ncbi:uncharacterized protein LOC116163162 [Photinus pyralis]|uniref:uncharacterized protein LOC116163162 n=1 Tax=Photinus pyralis TaxID=7054 RepID=UPI00126722E6|nr:uncharacterized protein LOC116163162 [Photinus pyralis]
MDLISKNKPFHKENFFTMDTAPIVSLFNMGTQQQTASGNETINQVWTKEHFDELNGLGQRKSYLKANLCLDLKPLKTSWASTNHYERDINGNEDEEDEDEGDFKHETQDTSPTPTTPDKEIVSPSHHARRPMNAFLIFCKKHRPIVRQKFPHLENRGVTRILGEWWALLETGEKSCYTNLAKEYKDAFFSANPDFKWYKLPAPPLRTLNTRPISVYKISSPLASPTHTTPTSAEFTPGKLADETQLGNLTSLMQTNCSTTKTPDSHNTYASEAMDTNSFLNNNNNNNVDVENNSEKHKQLLITPSTDTITTSFPPKPIKKRKFYEFSESDNNNVAQDIFGIKSQAEVDYNENTFIKDTPDCDPNNGFHEPENMTQQELMNKVVDSMFPDKGAGMDEETKDETKETRKSGRSCKGRRYAEFMMEGKLLGTKQIKRFTQYKPDIINKFDNALSNIFYYNLLPQTIKSSRSLKQFKTKIRFLATNDDEGEYLSVFPEVAEAAPKVHQTADDTIKPRVTGVLGPVRRGRNSKRILRDRYHHDLTSQKLVLTASLRVPLQGDESDGTSSLRDVTYLSWSELKTDWKYRFPNKR